MDWDAPKPGFDIVDDWPGIPNQLEVTPLMEELARQMAHSIGTTIDQLLEG